jgi:hypothetical protein
MRAIIFLKSTSRFAPAKQGDFLWSNEHNCHIWQGRELTIEEFNQVVDAVMEDDNYYIRPSVRLLPPKFTRKKTT